MGESKEDRRKYRRIATDQVISFAPVDARDLLGVSRNVSIGGIRFEAVGCEIDLGDVLRVTFNVGDSHHRRRRARWPGRRRSTRSRWTSASSSWTSTPQTAHALEAVLGESELD